MGYFGEGSRSEEPCSQTLHFGVVWHWSSSQELTGVQIPMPEGRNGLGIVAECQQRELGHNPSAFPASQPSLAMPPAPLHLFSPLGKSRNKIPVLNTIPCVALRTCCRKSLQSPEEGGEAAPALFSSPCMVRKVPPALLGEKVGKAAVLGIFLYIFIND